MKLSIITINRNNAEGLRKTLDSVGAQSCMQFEQIIIDGASHDGSVEVIKNYVETASTALVRWVSEPDTGIYNAMNKGIRMAEGDYIQILNSGDMLYDDHVVEKMQAELERLNTQAAKEGGEPVGILYGNMLKKDFSTGKLIGKSGYAEYSLSQFYWSTLNHDCAYIRRDLFDRYGLYDEELKIVSDWKWYLQAIGLGDVKPVYVDIDVTIFDAGGISETNLKLRNEERRKVLEAVMPPAVLCDYDHHAFDGVQMDRLRKHHLYKLVWFIERVLFKLEKWRLV